MHFFQNGSEEFFETSHEVRVLKGKNLAEPDFWEKSHFGDNTLKYGFRVKAKMLLSNQIAGFLNFNISKTVGGITLILCM